jgi:hypothetical protein
LSLLTLHLPLLGLLLALDLPLLSLLPALDLLLPLLRLLSLNLHLLALLLPLLWLLTLHLHLLALLLPLLRLLALDLLNLTLLTTATPGISTPAALLAATRISATLSLLRGRRPSRISTSAAFASTVAFTLTKRQAGKKERHRQNRKNSYKEKVRSHYSSSLVENHGTRSFVLPSTKAITVPFAKRMTYRAVKKCKEPISCANETICDLKRYILERIEQILWTFNLSRRPGRASGRMSNVRD